MKFAFGRSPSTLAGDSVRAEEPMIEWRRIRMLRNAVKACSHSRDSPHSRDACITLHGKRIEPCSARQLFQGEREKLTNV